MYECQGLSRKILEQQTEGVGTESALIVDLSVIANHVVGAAQREPYI